MEFSQNTSCSKIPMSVQLLNENSSSVEDIVWIKQVFSHTRKHIKAYLFFHFQTVIATGCKSSRYFSWKWSEPREVQSKQIFKAILQTSSCVSHHKSVRGIRSPNQDAAVIQTNVPYADPVAVKACGQITLLEKQKHCRGLQKKQTPRAATPQSSLSYSPPPGKLERPGTFTTLNQNSLRNRQQNKWKSRHIPHFVYLSGSGGYRLRM